MDISASLITVDLRSRKLIYEQLIDNIRELILDGSVSKDDCLPSVRTLARELGINPNTIQKAYAELERQSIIMTYQGRGSFITVDKRELIKDSLSSLKREMKHISDKAVKLELTSEEFESLARESFALSSTQQSKEENRQ